MKRLLFPGVKRGSSSPHILLFHFRAFQPLPITTTGSSRRLVSLRYQ
jgi:hypothetical protein